MQKLHPDTNAPKIPFAQYRRALAFVAPYWRSLALVMVLSLLSTAVALAQPYISRLLIDDALLRHDLHALGVIAAAMVAVTVVGFAATFSPATATCASPPNAFLTCGSPFTAICKTSLPVFLPKARLGTSFPASTTTSAKSSVSARGTTLLSVLSKFFSSSAASP